MKRWSIGPDRRAGSRPAVFRLAAVAAYPEKREKRPGKTVSLRPTAFLTHFRFFWLNGMEGIGADRRAGSRPCGLSLSGCRRISGKTGKTSGKYPALRAGCFPSASPVLPAARNKGIGTDRRAGSRPAVFRLAAVAAYPEERETPGENSQPAADRPPRAFPVLPAARLVALEKSCH